MKGNPQARLSPPRRRRRRRERPFCALRGEIGHMLAGKQIVKFARISTRLVSSCRASAAVREIAPLSTDAIVRRWQIFTGTDAVCASSAATFTEREAAVNARNNDPAGGGALL
jgi:uncharacterized protein YmfQ (DUF2313 family)